MFVELGNGPFDIVFDTHEMKPACALIQAMGGSPGVASLFDPEVWLTSPTPRMKVYRTTKKELEELVEIVHQWHLPKRYGGKG